MKQTKCYLNALGMLCAAGGSNSNVQASISALQPNLTITDVYHNDAPLPIALFNGDLPTIPLADKKWQSRNNQFALSALNQIRAEVETAIKLYGSHRIAVIIGTSTSGIAESEEAIKMATLGKGMSKHYDYGLQEMGAPAQFVAQVLGVSGPVYGISTACSSGAKALASARRLIRAGLCDAVIAGGVDTLCKLTVQGFSSLQAVSKTQCNPFSVNRNGINIGEGAALFLLSCEPQGVELVGTGESSDAHHISAPHPEGEGAKRCMNAALADASLNPAQINYVNLHGTATELNDQMESKAMCSVFGSNTLCSSTKPFTGHTLGAAGAVEAGICWLMLASQQKETFLPVHLWDACQDPALPTINFVTPKTTLVKDMQYVLSNSFAFGGNNISLILGRVS